MVWFQLALPIHMVSPCSDTTSSLLLQFRNNSVCDSNFLQHTAIFRNILSILGVFILHVVGGGRKLHKRWQAVKLLPLHRCQKVYNKTQWVGTGQFATAQQIVHGNSMVVLVSLARSQRQQNAPRQMLHRQQVVLERGTWGQGYFLSKQQPKHCSK